MTIKARFRTFCVIWDLETKKVCALRQAIWELDVDNGRVAPQHAIIVQADAAVSADPAMPPPTLTAAPQITTPPVAGTPGRRKITFPNTEPANPP